MYIKSWLVLALLAYTKAEKLTLADIEDSMTLEDDILVRSPEEVYRLPTTVKPILYDIFIDFYFGEKTDNPFSYNGKENIIIQAQQSDVFQIVLHANVDRINNVTVETEDGENLDLGTTPYILEREYHFLKIYLQQALVMNANYTLKIDYSSTMNEGPMKRGIWRGWYKDSNGVERIYATTHFQPYNARQAFPCWDEPLFKAVFNVHLSAPASYTKMFSNTEVASIDKYVLSISIYVNTLTVSVLTLWMLVYYILCTD